jgi:hypothetical protein
MQHLTLAEARQLKRLTNAFNKDIRAIDRHYDTFPGGTLRRNMEPRQYRQNARSVTRSSASIRNYVNRLAQAHGITANNVMRNSHRYEYNIPGTRVSQMNVRRIITSPLVSGNREWSRWGINEAVKFLRRNGIPVSDALRNVLRQSIMAGTRGAVAVRTLQRAFRAKRAAKKNPLHAEMNVLRRVPISGIRMNNGNVRPLKPSDIAKARKYLAEQGFRTVIRTSRRRTT